MSLIFTQMIDGYDEHKLERVFETAVETGSILSLLAALSKLSQMYQGTIEIYARDPYDKNDWPYLYLSIGDETNKLIGTGAIRYHAGAETWVLAVI